MIEFLLFLSLSAAQAADADTAAAEPTEESATAEDAAKPVKLAKDDPNYVRCRRLRITGSNIKRKVCQTNAQWERSASTGNDAAGEIVDNANKGFTRSN